VTGIYRRSVMLASGRYAMLDDGMGFLFGAVEASDRTTAGATDCRDTARRGRDLGNWSNASPFGWTASLFFGEKF
jgi:hypothetical protein